MTHEIDLHEDIGEILLTEEQIQGEGPRARRPDQRRLRRPPADPRVGPQGLAAVHGRPHARDRHPASGSTSWRSARTAARRPSRPGLVRILKDLSASIADEDVLIVEDIIDTGLTLNYLIRYLRGKNPASLRICTLLDKPARRLVEIPVDYTGFVIPDRFVVGYGLDYGEFTGTCACVGVLRPEVYTEVAPECLRRGRRGDDGHASAARSAPCARPAITRRTTRRWASACSTTSPSAPRTRSRRTGSERVAIVDFDVHHGNGTQDIFWPDPRVLYASSHQWPLYPGTGARSETRRRQHRQRAAAARRGLGASSARRTRESCCRRSTASRPSWC